MTDTHDTSYRERDISYDKFLRLGGLTILLLVFGIGGWSAMAKVKGAVIATGTVVVEGNPKTLQHLDGGIVGEILVKNGDLITANQVVLRLDPTMLDANNMIVRTRLYETLARLARLEAERDDLPEIQWPSVLSSIMDQAKAPSSERPSADIALVQSAIEGQLKLFTARRRAGAGQVNQLQQRIAQFNDQIGGMRSQIRANEDQLSLIVQELDGLKELLERGFVSKTRILNLEREQARIRGDVANFNAEIARVKNSIGETQVQIQQLRRERLEEVLTELRDVQTEGNELREQMTTTSDQRMRIDVRAPVSGIVHNLSVTTIGGVVAPGQELMQIIPQDDRLIIEAQVQPQDIDQVFEGQDTTVRFSAFNQRRTPELNGTVLGVSADRLLDPVTSLPYYTARIEVSAEELALLGNLNLLPGMPAEAFMQTKSRSVLSYLVKPLTDSMSRSLREE